MAQAFLAERDYASMMNDIRRDSYSIRMAELKKSIEVTNDGYVVATTRDELNAIMSLFGQVDGYHKLEVTKASGDKGVDVIGQVRSIRRMCSS